MSASSAERLLALLWDRYAAEVAPARTFAELSGGSFHNDHVAFRSLARSSERNTRGSPCGCAR